MPARQSSRLVDTAAALAVHGKHVQRFFLNEEVTDLVDPRTKWFAYCRSRIPMGRDLKFGRDELLHCYYAEAEYLDRGNAHKGEVFDPERWKAYRTALFEQLQRNQNKDGSWPAGNGICVGPVYATAIWCTILQLDGNRHPAARVYEQSVK